MHGNFDRRRRLRDALSLRALLLAGGAAVALAGVAGGALFAGYVIGEEGVFPSDFLGRVHRKIERTVVGPRPPARLTDRAYMTHLIRLDAEIGALPSGEGLPWHQTRGNGGGLASFGEDVLLLPYEGRVYAASSPDDIRPTQVFAPRNNREAYAAAAEDPAFAALNIRDGYLRYNDLAHFRAEGSHGLLASYVEYHPDRACYTNTVARLDIDPDIVSIDEVAADPEDWRILHRTEPCLPFKTRHLALEGHMAGGRLAFHPPSTLYMTSGDFHFDGMRSEPGVRIAQDPDAEYGKILEIDVETGESRILSSGHRNPQGILATPDGTLYTVEHGPRGGDELNVIRAGANYGWPLESLGVTYESNSPIPGSYSHGRHEHFEPPIFSWAPSPAVSALVQARGIHPTWEGDLLLGSLIDQSLHRLRLQDGRVIYDERIEIGSRIRDLLQHEGRLVLWTDNNELVFLTPADYSNMTQMFELFVERYDLSEGMARSLEAAVGRCAECHSFQPGDHEKSPSLARIHGDEIASTSFDGYSQALAGRGGAWTDEALAEFLRDPQAFAPGSSMPDPGIEDRDVIETLIAYLADMDRAF